MFNTRVCLTREFREFVISKFMDWVLRLFTVWELFSFVMSMFRPTTIIIHLELSASKPHSPSLLFSHPSLSLSHPSLSLSLTPLFSTCLCSFSGLVPLFHFSTALEILTVISLKILLTFQSLLFIVDKY